MYLHHRDNMSVYIVSSIYIAIYLNRFLLTTERYHPYAIQ